ISAEGTTTITYFAHDNANNTETLKTVLIRIDKTPPAIDGSRTPAANAAGWNKEDVTTNYTASDTLSGIDGGSASSGSFVFNSEGENQLHIFTVSDAAGNTTTVTVDHVNIDKTPPTLLCGSADGAWHGTDISIACTASETISSLADSANINFNLVTTVPL